MNALTGRSPNAADRRAARVHDFTGGRSDRAQRGDVIEMDGTPAAIVPSDLAAWER